MIIDKIKVITIGGAGLIGSRVTSLLNDSINFKDLSRKDGVDITNPHSLKSIEDDTKSRIVFLLAAKTDVDGCEKDKELGKEGDAWKINVEGVRNVANACLKNNKKVIYVSTDFVFDGENTPEGGYSEEDAPHPINWYSKTKYEGEKALIESGAKFIIVRTAYPYQKYESEKPDFVHAIGKRLQQNLEVQAVSDHIMSPTYIDDFAMAIRNLIEEDAEGIYHITGSGALTPFDAALLIAKKLGSNLHLVKKTTRADFFKDRAVRPFDLSMKNAKILKSGVVMRSFQEGIKEIF